jgi:hypothetical protein
LARLGAEPLHQDARVSPSQEARKQHDQDRAQTTTNCNLTGGDTSAVLDVLTLAFAFPTHIWLSHVAGACPDGEEMSDSLTE